MGRTDEARAMLGRLEDMLAEEPDSSSWQSANIRFNLAYAYAWMGDTEKAFEHLLPPSKHVSYTDRLDVFNPVWR